MNTYELPANTAKIRDMTTTAAIRLSYMLMFSIIDVTLKFERLLRDSAHGLLV